MRQHRQLMPTALRSHLTIVFILAQSSSGRGIRRTSPAIFDSAVRAECSGPRFFSRNHQPNARGARFGNRRHGSWASYFLAQRPDGVPSA
jgi:hypothetical protein